MALIHNQAHKNTCILSRSVWAVPVHVAITCPTCLHCLVFYSVCWKELHDPHSVLFISLCYHSFTPLLFCYGPIIWFASLHTSLAYYVPVHPVLQIHYTPNSNDSSSYALPDFLLPLYSFLLWHTTNGILLCILLFIPTFWLLSQTFLLLVHLNSWLLGLFLSSFLGSASTGQDSYPLRPFCGTAVLFSCLPSLKL